MKKVLLVCNHFAPDNTIAAVRTTKLAKYLVAAGYDVRVIAEQKYDGITDSILEQDAKGIHVIRAVNSLRIRKVIELYKKFISPVKSRKFANLNDRIKINRKTGKYEFYPFETAHPIIGSLDYLFELLRQYDLYLNVKEKLPNYFEVDYLLTSYGDFFCVYVGKYIHRNKRNIPWIFDIRDPICRYKFTPDYMRVFAKMQERYIWKEADSIIAVSKGICRRVPKKYRKKVHCITNGYDKSDRSGIRLEKGSIDKLIFTYTGSMYGGIQNLTPFFRCVRELMDENRIVSDRIEICYAGNASAFTIFFAQGEQYGLGKYCKYVGKLERKDALKLQMESDVLLVASFDYQSDVGGVITGKALEYMSANKPMIAIINGDVKKSELAEIIKNGNLGVAYEEVCKGEDIKNLKEYLFHIYTEHEKSGLISHRPNYKVLSKYDYRNLSKRLIKIMDTIR